MDDGWAWLWVVVCAGACVSEVRVSRARVRCGAQVHDPYRWLEDDLAAAKWVAAQEGRTQEYFRSIAATRDLFKERLAAAYESEKTGCTFPVGRGSQRRYYFYRHEGLRSHACLMSSKEVDGDAHVFFDPNTLSSDGSKALGASAFSPSGKFWAYGVSSSGSGARDISRVPALSPARPSLSCTPNPHTPLVARTQARSFKISSRFCIFFLAWLSAQNGKLFTSAMLLPTKTKKRLNGSNLAAFRGFPTTLGSIYIYAYMHIYIYIYIYVYICIYAHIEHMLACARI